MKKKVKLKNIFAQYRVNGNVVTMSLPMLKKKYIYIPLNPI